MISHKEKTYFLPLLEFTTPVQVLLFTEGTDMN